MFEQTFVEGSVPGHTAYSVTISSSLQVLALCAAVLLPLLYSETLPSAQLKSMLMAPAPPAPKVPVETRASRRTPATPRVLQLSKQLTAPAAIPKTVASVDETPPLNDLGGLSNGTGQDAGGNPLLFGSTGGLAPAPPAPLAVKPKPAGPIRVGGVVAEANLIDRVEPLYPALARAARVQGTVEFSAVISKDGRVEHLRLVRGHPLLVNAARTAILEWRYRPTMLNGEAVEVSTDIVVNFRLGG